MSGKILKFDNQNEFEPQVGPLLTLQAALPFVELTPETADASFDEIDYEFLAIFETEANQALRLIKAETAGECFYGNLRSHFHALEGAARNVGLYRLAALANLITWHCGIAIKKQIGIWPSSFLQLVGSVVETIDHLKLEACGLLNTVITVEQLMQVANSVREYQFQVVRKSARINLNSNANHRQNREDHSENQRTRSAIFGNFAEMPLLDIFSAFGRSSGLFLVSNHPTGKRYDIWIDKGIVLGVAVEGAHVGEPEARSVLVMLINSQEGEFEFKRMEVADSMRRFRILLNQVMISESVAVDNFAAVRAQLPDPSTRFIPVNGASAELEGEVLDFWKSVWKALISGASANELSNAFEIPIDQTLLRMFKLRTLGLIEPVRAWEPGNAEHSGRSPEGKPQAPVLLPPENKREENHSAAASLPSRLEGVKPATLQQSVMTKLLSSFRSLFNK